jgi:excisionase family DNA binding protein
MYTIGDYTMYTKSYSKENSRLVGDSRLVYEVPEAGEMLGLGRNASYQAARRGDIPTIKIGKLIRVPKAAFDLMLKIVAAPSVSTQTKETL